MLVKTTELTGAALDWAVAKCLNCDYVFIGVNAIFVLDSFGEDVTWQPSTNWAQGGPIIEREDICSMPILEDDNSTSWAADKRIDNLFDQNFTGQTPLTAAMRCYVASKLGVEVEIPSELV